MDVGQDDLVLHEGDGKIRRPSKLKPDGKSALKLKKMPSPRRVSPSTDSATDGASTVSTMAQRTKEDLAPKEKQVGKKVQITPSLVAPNTSGDCDSDDGDSVFEDWDDEDRKSREFSKSNRQDVFRSSDNQQDLHAKNTSYELTSEDLEICQRLDDEYERALEERDIGYNARYSSVRQTAILSIFFMALYMVQGTVVYRRLLLINHEKQTSTAIEREEGEEDEFDVEFSSWSIPESLFFSIFTITTVGYGREDLPTTPSFQAYTIFYIMVGIAAITIMVAQVYQCIALEASRARLSQDKQDELRRRSGLMLKGSNRHKIRVTSPTGSSTHSSKHGPGNPSDDIIFTSYTQTGIIPRTLESCFRHIDATKFFFRETEIGKAISIVFPFAGMVFGGATVVCLLEEWTFLESLYFSVVSLTTVGFGDYVPTRLPTIWFCIFWLPLSIGFMSMYLSNVATFYIRLSDRNIRRIERHLRRRLQKAKEKAEAERAEILQRAYRGQEIEIEIAAGSSEGGVSESLREIQRTGSTDSTGSTDQYKRATIPKRHARSVMQRQKEAGFNILPIMEDDNSEDGTVLIGAGADAKNAKTGVAERKTGHKRRQQIIENCRAKHTSSELGGDGEGISNDRTMKCMKDVIDAVRNTIDSKKDGKGVPPAKPGGNDASKFMSIHSTQNMIDYSIFRRQNQSKKPSFALRVLVQERFAKIIAMEVAGFHSSLEVKEQTLAVTIVSISDTIEKWFIPRRARKAFRSVAFEILYFVGEHALITRGADAMFELTPFEFHGLFSTLVAAMGDADIMEGWLAKTDALAMADLQQAVLQRSAPDDEGGMRKRVFSID